ncbi:10578_t:CDS:2 [Acaulospora colombiana]|uniref:10578_t:CDS:1 n=1 Tax=Acaulospora colombiana TaxID=27376 RepID=A0ACA9MJ66_9GLOM|nr:10578_t:CDS:2 [Acaulospora colombiana]
MIEVTKESQNHETPVVINEIQNFVEAHWIHLPNQQRIIFNKSDNITEVITDQNQQTSLTEYFITNAQDPDASNLLYVDFPQQYTWNKMIKRWKKHQHGNCIVRIFMAHPGEGVKNFEKLKVVDNVLCATFKESAQRRGFLENDDKHQQYMAEAREFQMPNQLCNLFTMLLVFGDIADRDSGGSTPNSSSPSKPEHISTKTYEDQDLAKANILNEAQPMVFDEILGLIN